MPSFDLVSSLDIGELKNALNMAQKQIKGRYDFKDSKCSLTLKNDKEIELVAEDNYKMEAALSMFYASMTKRNLGLKCIEVKSIEPVGNQMLKQMLILNSGINKENAKTINKLVKTSGLKVQSQYMDEKIRITSKKIDDLQGIYQFLKSHKEIEIDLSMTNMK